MHSYQLTQHDEDIWFVEQHVESDHSSFNVELLITQTPVTLVVWYYYKLWYLVYNWNDGLDLHVNVTRHATTCRRIHTCRSYVCFRPPLNEYPLYECGKEYDVTNMVLSFLEDFVPACPLNNSLRATSNIILLYLIPRNLPRRPECSGAPTVLASASIDTAWTVAIAWEYVDAIDAVY